jgi:hypothetical protein
MNSISIELKSKKSDEDIFISILKELKKYRNKQGLYVIKPVSESLLSDICRKLDYEKKSDIAYVGKASLTKNSSLYHRSKQEMGWSNFDGATFVRKIGIYLGFDVKDKRNKLLKERTRWFICQNFKIELQEVAFGKNLLQEETNLIRKLNPCMNVKKNKKNK